MNKRPGTITNNELWIRCVFCGDSQRNTQKTHLSINLSTGLYHCYRCHAGGRLKTAQLFTLILQVGVENVFVEDQLFSDLDRQREIPILSPGPGNHRPSALERFHWTDRAGTLYDAFEIRDAVDEEVTGVYLRNTTRKESRICGGTGFSWVGAHLPNSTPIRPLRVVEGPYDVIEDRDICTYSLVTYGIQDLRSHYLVLCPDGDVWLKPDLFRTFVKKVHEYLWKPRGPYIVGVEILPDGQDPDTVPPDRREFVSREVMIQSRLANKRKYRIQQIQEILDDNHH